MWHEQTTVFQQAYPFFIRGGMRVARCHREHLYLTQQATSMWGSCMSNRVDLGWPQVQSLFRDGHTNLPRSVPLKGEVVCGYGPWSLCRGLVKEAGRRVEGMIPREIRRAELSRIGTYDPAE